MSISTIQLRASAGDGRYTVLRPEATAKENACAYIVDLGSSDAFWDVHCNDVTLELNSEKTATVQCGEKFFANVPYWEVPDNTHDQMAKCHELSGVGFLLNGVDSRNCESQG